MTKKQTAEIMAKHLAPDIPLKTHAHLKPNDDTQQILSEILEWDQDTLMNKEADFRFLVSAGPFRVLEPDDTLNFQVAMVVGKGLRR